MNCYEIEKLLQNKARELQVEIEQWAKKNLALRNNQFLILTLTIEEGSMVDARIIHPNQGKRLRTRESDQKLTDRDFTEIFKLPLSNLKRKQLEIFKENPGRMFSKEEIEADWRKRDCIGYSRFNFYPNFSVQNTMLSRYKLPYRIKNVAGRDWKFRLCIVEDV